MDTTDHTLPPSSVEPEGSPPVPAVPWDRQAGEPARWFERFDTFRLLGPGRSVEQAWRTETGRKGEAAARWHHEATRWRWRERAEAWDEAVRPERQRKRLAALEAMQAEHLSIGLELREKARKALRAIDPTTTTEALRLLEMAVELERRSIEEPALLELQRQVDEIKRGET